MRRRPRVSRGEGWGFEDGLGLRWTSSMSRKTSTSYAACLSITRRAAILAGREPELSRVASLKWFEANGIFSATAGLLGNGGKLWRRAH